MKENIYNVVFLDVDGVLAHHGYRNKDTEHINIEKVQLLKEICDKGNAKVVIISSWRGSETYTPHIYHILINVLTSNGIDVIGDAPHIDSEVDGDLPHGIDTITLDDIPHIKIKHGTGRAAEVESWLNNHNVESFVILDDEDFDWADYGYENNWVQSSWYGGLQPEHVEQALRILN